MIVRNIIVIVALSALSCSTTTTGETDQNGSARDENGAPEPSKSDGAQLNDIEWANQFFLTQIYDDRFNPDGIEVDTDSNNCGPASLAMLMRERGTELLALTAEMTIDHARATMYPDYPDIDPSSLSDGARLYMNGSVLLVDDDTQSVFFDSVDDAPSVAQGIRSGGATPVFGYSWEELGTLLETTGAVIAHGHITDAWRAHFSSDYGSSSPGAVPHFIAIFPASTAGQFIVCDPMYRGGPVLMSRGNLGSFFRSPVNVFDTTIRIVAWKDAASITEQNPGPAQ